MKKTARGSIVAGDHRGDPRPRAMTRERDQPRPSSCQKYLRILKGRALEGLRGLNAKTSGVAQPHILATALSVHHNQ